MLLNRILVLLINCDTESRLYVCTYFLLNLFLVEQLPCVCNTFELHRVSIQEESNLLSSSVQLHSHSTKSLFFQLIVSIVRILNCSVLLFNMHNMRESAMITILGLVFTVERSALSLRCAARRRASGEWSARAARRARRRRRARRARPWRRGRSRCGARSAPRRA